MADEFPSYFLDLQIDHFSKIYRGLGDSTAKDLQDLNYKTVKDVYNAWLTDRFIKGEKGVLIKFNDIVDLFKRYKHSQGEETVSQTNVAEVEAEIEAEFEAVIEVAENVEESAAGNSAGPSSQEEIPNNAMATKIDQFTSSFNDLLKEFCQKL